MMMYPMLLAAAIQLPIPIPSHGHTAGPTPLQTTLGSGATCAGIGSLALETAWSPSTGVTLLRMTLDGKKLNATSTETVASALKRLWIARTVEVGCFSGDTFNVYITGALRQPSTGNGYVSALVTKGGVELLP